MIMIIIMTMIMVMVMVMTMVMVMVRRMIMVMRKPQRSAAAPPKSDDRVVEIAALMNQ